MAGTSSAKGVQIDLVSGSRMDALTSMEKIRMILDGVRAGNIVILEEGLTPEEETKLIEVTMAEISPDEFDGIEVDIPTAGPQQRGYPLATHRRRPTEEADGDWPGKPDRDAAQG